MEIMIQSTLDFLRGDALGEEIKRVDIATILETVCDRLVDSGHVVALRGETHTPLPCQPADQQKRWRPVGHHHVAPGNFPPRSQQQDVT